jgi:protein-disulfide isomerase
VQTADSGAVIVVFSDFECPFCKHFAATTDRVLARHPQAVTVVHRNFPLSSIHAHARSAAIAGECAALQGRFATFHAFVFSHQDSLAGLQWPSVAKAIGVADTAAFRVCLADGRADAALAADSLAAEALHIAGTPLVMVNGWLFDGTPTEDAVEKAIAKRHSLFN